MKYNGQVNGQETEILIEKEGIRWSKGFLDYSKVTNLVPVSHRIRIETFADGTIEISMLGFSYDGFWEELMKCFGDRSLESLFVEEEQIMLCEGEYAMPGERGRGKIALYPDAVCILPQTSQAVRIPLCFTESIRAEGYQIYLTLHTSEEYMVGKMGYDTKPFAERAEAACMAVKKKRSQALSNIALQEPFTHKGLFRTKQPEHYWNAAFGNGVCAVELFTDQDSATYLYRFDGAKEAFLAELEKAMEATGIHREVIYITEEQLQASPLYCMTVHRTPAVRYLRAHSDGRIIHSKNHREKLDEYLGG